MELNSRRKEPRLGNRNKQITKHEQWIELARAIGNRATSMRHMISAPPKLANGAENVLQLRMPLTRCHSTRLAFTRFVVHGFDQFGTDTELQNFAVMSEYVTEMGRIRHAKLTGLRPVNQRKISKAVRRAIGLGLMPSVHRHPEMLKAAMKNDRSSGF